MTRKKVLVLGGNFGGLTAALAVQHELQGDVHVRVVSASDRFVFNPSLIWLPFGKRAAGDITFPLAPTFDVHGVDFVHAEATAHDLRAKNVDTTAGTYDYDYLVIATGYRNDFDAVEGLGPGGNAHTITTLADAEQAGRGWRRFLDAPGDIVVGAVEGAGCFGAAYEYLFNVSHQLRKAGLKKQVKLDVRDARTRVGPLRHRRAAPWRATAGHVHAQGTDRLGGRHRHRPRRRGPDRARRWDRHGLRLRHDHPAVPRPGGDRPGHRDRRCEALRQGRDTYQSEVYDDVYAVGIAAAVEVPWQTAHAFGIPKTGLPTEQQAHVAAKNIVAQIKGEPPQAHKTFGDIPAVCVMDAGNNGVLILADKMLPPRKHGVLIPGPQSHLMKLAFEKYFLWKASHGYVNLP